MTAIVAKRFSVESTYETIRVTIPANQDLSQDVNLGGMTLVAVYCLSNPVGVYKLNFMVAPDDVSAHVPLYDIAGVLYEINVKVACCLSIVSTEFEGVKYLQLHSTTTEATDRQFILAVRNP